MPPEKLARVDGRLDAWTPGREDGSAGRRGPECDLSVANDTAPGSSGVWGEGKAALRLVRGAFWET